MYDKRGGQGASLVGKNMNPHPHEQALGLKFQSLAPTQNTGPIHRYLIPSTLRDEDIKFCLDILTASVAPGSMRDTFLRE